MSLPTRERGLKYPIYPFHQLNGFVAPHAGARIEIALMASYRLTAPSLPTRERGLKYIAGTKLDRVTMSLPTRERGLKSRRA